jgi:threonine aldolase
LLAGGDAHVLVYEMGAAAVVGGISSRTWGSVGAALDPSQIGAMIRKPGGYTVATRAIAVEQTHNLGGGTVIPLPALRALREISEESGVPLHCDGARIWHAHVADGVPLDTYGRLFDTLSVCLSKGLGAPVGSLVVGSAERIARARTIRKRMGGGMRQAGILAAAGDYALTHNLTRLAEDHSRAQRLATALSAYGVVDPALVRTNLILVDLSGTKLDAAGLVARAAAKDVHIAAMLPHLARVVTHLDIDDNALDRASTVLTGILAEEA